MKGRPTLILAVAVCLVGLALVFSLMRGPGESEPEPVDPIYNAPRKGLLGPPVPDAAPPRKTVSLRSENDGLSAHDRFAAGGSVLSLQPAARPVGNASDAA